MSMSHFKDGECVRTTQKHCPRVEFVIDQTESGLPQRHGFPTSQLLQYRLGPNDADGEETPPERLTIAFATADVVLFGWRLGWIPGRNPGADSDRSVGNKVGALAGRQRH